MELVKMTKDDLEIVSEWALINGGSNDDSNNNALAKMYLEIELSIDDHDKCTYIDSLQLDEEVFDYMKTAVKHLKIARHNLGLIILKVIELEKNN